MSLTKDLTVFFENCQCRNAIKDLSNKIIGACISVHNELGCGLLESCYRKALYFEIRSQGLSVSYNAPFNVSYKGNQVGEFFADLVVECKVIIELKSVKALGTIHEAQLLNYLHISGFRLGYLVNFQGERLIWKRFVV